ncbi:hypothetical protein B566_EDAN006338 [Ephemera danica]|nr:hypothetical protein B566_EDAN006338 [Ephemera danica]
MTRTPKTRVSVFNETPNISETDQKSWHEAYDFCRQHNMELATIESAAENEAIKQNIKGMKHREGCLIGLNDLGFPHSRIGIRVSQTILALNDVVNSG